MAKKRLQPTKKSQYLDKVEQLDNFGTGKDSFDLLLSGAEDACAAFIERVKENIHNSDLNINTGAIENISIESKDGEILIKGEPHILYQDRGVSGVNNKRDTVHYYSDKKPPMNVFKSLIDLKNIQLRDNETYYGDASPFADLELSEDPERDKINLAYAMREHIYQQGFEGHNHWSSELPQLVKDLAANIKGFTISMLKQNIEVKESAKGLYPNQ